MTGVGFDAKGVVGAQTYVFFYLDHGKLMTKEEKTVEITK